MDPGFGLTVVEFEACVLQARGTAELTEVTLAQGLEIGKKGIQFLQNPYIIYRCMLVFPTNPKS